MCIDTDRFYLITFKKFSVAKYRYITSNIATQLENKLPSSEDRGETDRITIPAKSANYILNPWP